MCLSYAHTLQLLPPRLLRWLWVVLFAPSVWASALPCARAEQSEQMLQLTHVPVEEQLVLTPIPLFVARSDERIVSVHIAYRSFGMLPRSSSFLETADGFTFLIPCSEVTEPRLEYSLWGLDAAGNIIAVFGSLQSLVKVRVVAQRSLPAPAWPGLPPPAQCLVGSICTPGTLGCDEAVEESSLGQMCHAERPCAEGLACEDGTCALSLGASRSTQAPAKTSRFSIEVGAGVGFHFLGGAPSPDRLPPIAALDALRERGASEREAQQALYDAGWDCQIEKAPGVLGASDCAVAMQRSGVALVPLLHVALGIRLSQRLTLSPFARVQMRRGEGPLAGTSLGMRAEYLLTTPREHGLRISALLGAAFGSLQSYGRNVDGRGGVPAASSAALDALGGVVHAGLRAGYRWARHFGLSVTTALQLGLPNTTLALDTVAGTEVYF